MRPDDDATVLDILNAVDRLARLFDETSDLTFIVNRR